MSKPDDGGPAFSRPYSETPSYFSSDQIGMSLLDYFAGQVLIGLSIKRAGATDAADAKNAYSLARAMLRERALEDITDGR